MKYRYHVGYVTSNKLGSASFGNAEITVAKRIKTMGGLDVLINSIKSMTPEANNIVILGFTLLKRSWF